MKTPYVRGIEERKKAGKGPSLYYVSKETGWVGSEKGQLLLTFSTIHASVGWVGQKKTKNVLT